VGPEKGWVVGDQGKPVAEKRKGGDEERNKVVQKKKKRRSVRQRLPGRNSTPSKEK